MRKRRKIGFGFKYLAVILTAALIGTAFAGCGKSHTEKESPETKEVKDESAVTVGELQDDESKEEADSWGRVEDTITTDDGVTIDRYSIRLPRYRGKYHMYSKISEQGDETAVLLSGQTPDSPKVESSDQVLPSYVEYIIDSLQEYYGIRSSDFEVSIENSEAVKIGEYDMCVSKGTISYDYNGDHRSHEYVAYATILKPSGNCAYWMVYELSDY